MSLNEVKPYTRYLHKPTGRHAYVTAFDCDDGASLIIEFYDENDDIFSGEFMRTEACFLEQVKWHQGFMREEVSQ